MVRSVTRTEPEWDDESRAMVLALLTVERDTCGGCGLPLSEALEADEHDTPEYKAYGPTCAGCRAIHTWRQAASDEQRATSRITLELHAPDR